MRGNLWPNVAGRRGGTIATYSTGVRPRRTLSPVAIEVGILALSAPFLLFPTVKPLATAVALTSLAVWWLGRTALARRPFPVTPLNGALLLWATMVGIGILVTAHPDATLPKATNLILGLATVRMVVLVGQSNGALRWLMGGLGLMGLGLLALGLVTVSWPAKVSELTPALTLLPADSLSLPEAISSGVNPNQLGGTLAMLLPVAVAGVIWEMRAKRREGEKAKERKGEKAREREGERAKRREDNGTGRMSPLRTWMGLAGTGVLAGALVLTQSRSAWIGAIVGIVALLVLLGATSVRRHWRRASLVLLALCGIGGLATVMALGPESVSALWETSRGVETAFAGTVNLSGRVEIWSRALYAIQDFPFTGCGLGAFREVLWLLYPPFTIPATTDLAHAHNIFLQVAVDTGIPGLIAYVALLFTTAAMALRTARTSPAHRYLALGLLGGLIALHTFGLTDALAPGSKPGLIFWTMLGLITVTERLSRETAGRETFKR